MPKLNYDDKWKAVATWLPKEELEAFRAVAAANNVSPAAYLRAMIVDVIAEEMPKVCVIRRRLPPDIFERYHEPDVAI